MADDLHLLSPAGFRATGVYAGIKSTQKPDIGLLVCETNASAAAVFTMSKVVSPAVRVGSRHVAAGLLRGIVMNSGNANACTGKQGEKNALTMCRLAARVYRCAPEDVLPSSTGIIGHQLPMDKIERGIIEAGLYLGDSLEHANLFSDAILTTDLKRKTAAGRVKIGREWVTVAGSCKGSGMIGPRLGLQLNLGKRGSGIGSKAGRATGKVRGKHATMLAYLTSDAKIPAPMLRRLMQESADKSFNSVTVDDHASTNDTACILASGLGAAIKSSSDIRKFADLLNEISMSLAYQIAADGEGATKVVAITVEKAASVADARTIARTIANSNLVKTAMHGNDPNWGRIVSAAGYADAAFDAEKCVLKLQGTQVFRKGQPVGFDPAKLSEALKSAEVQVVLTCNLGSASATCWTCDLSREYITINADYHT